MKNNITGFTLIELMMVVAIISITMSIGLPSFQVLISNSRVTSTANAMLSAYQLARSEAIRRRASVSVTSTDNWGTWQVSYIDTTASPSEESTIIETFKSSTNVIITKFGAVTGYNGSGKQIGGDCDVENSTPPKCGFIFENVDATRVLNIMTTGRLRVSGG